MNPNTAVVLVAIIGIVVPVLTLLIKFTQDRHLGQQAAAATHAIAQVSSVSAQQAVAAATAVEQVRADLITQNQSVSTQLDGLKVGQETIHRLVNSQLTEAVNRLSEIQTLHAAALSELEIMKVELETMKTLLRRLAPDDPRVQALKKAP